MFWRYFQTSHSVDMPGKGDLQRAISEVPKFNGPIVGSSDEELVHRVHSYAPDPSCMATYHSFQLPRSMPLLSDLFLVSQSDAASILADRTYQA